jgi:hypothetical protein
MPGLSLARVIARKRRAVELGGCQASQRMRCILAKCGGIDGIRFASLAQRFREAPGTTGIDHADLYPRTRMQRERQVKAVVAAGF